MIESGWRDSGGECPKPALPVPCPCSPLDLGTEPTEKQRADVVGSWASGWLRLGWNREGAAGQGSAAQPGNLPGRTGASPLRNKQMLSKGKMSVLQRGEQRLAGLATGSSHRSSCTCVDHRLCQPGRASGSPLGLARGVVPILSLRKFRIHKPVIRKLILILKQQSHP